MAYRAYPTGVAQDKVLEALGLTATDFDDANRIFAEIGIVVTSKRVGRSSEPVITRKSTSGAGWNGNGDADEWKVSYKQIDLAPVAHWIAD